VCKGQNSSNSQYHRHNALNSVTYEEIHIFFKNFHRVGLRILSHSNKPHFFPYFTEAVTSVPRIALVHLACNLAEEGGKMEDFTVATLSVVKSEERGTVNNGICC
jgi:hypothetical protein